ncbi:hypothetical protein SAMN04488132_105117 [Sediminibacterium ginsengisoli]|uniref:Uncharacterized protein n=1 Tax=Sediminibacterium ginsengisoli TaxID=413434 RepID=A0A1T4P305_9BACT|nr:hypothetical protein SAMN04488132_105117 [Sediminibacterium ginsengisoli]
MVKLYKPTRLSYKQRVRGSNPCAPTEKALAEMLRLFVLSLSQRFIVPRIGGSWIKRKTWGILCSGIQFSNSIKEEKFVFFFSLIGLGFIGSSPN